MHHVLKAVTDASKRSLIGFPVPTFDKLMADSSNSAETALVTLNKLVAKHHVTVPLFVSTVLPVTASTSADAKSDGSASDQALKVEQELACVNLFREPLGQPISNEIPRPVPFAERLQTVRKQHASFLAAKEASEAADRVLGEISAESKSTALKAQADKSAPGAEEIDLSAQMTQEQEQQQQQQQQAEEQAHVAPQFDNAWRVPDVWETRDLYSSPEALLQRSFYPLAEFAMETKTGAQLPFPSTVRLSANFAHRLHRELLPRRLANVTVCLEFSDRVRQSVRAAFACGLNQTRAFAARWLASFIGSGLRCCTVPVGSGKHALLAAFN